jgi:hypothetical protein
VSELKKGVTEFARLKAAFDHLKQVLHYRLIFCFITLLFQDHDALKVSLESSERIRLQQKELIAVLQKSHNMMSESSVITFNSLSTISQRPEMDSLPGDRNGAKNGAEMADISGKKLSSQSDVSDFLSEQQKWYLFLSFISLSQFLLMTQVEFVTEPKPSCSSTNSIYHHSVFIPKCGRPVCSPLASGTQTFISTKKRQN